MRFSIITCTYNSEKFLKENINSVKNQTFKDYEHIFIDGYSSDKTIKIIKKYQKENKNVKLFQFKPKGISDAMNKGIIKSEGEIIHILHSDDYYVDNNVLETVNQVFLENPKVKCVYGRVKFLEVITNKTIKITPRLKIFEKYNPLLFKIFDYIPHPSLFAMKKVYDESGLYDVNFRISMDNDFLLRIIDKYKFAYTPKIISVFRVHDLSTSSSKSNLLKLRKKSYEEHVLAIKKNLKGILKWFCLVDIIIVFGLKLLIAKFKTKN